MSAVPVKELQPLGVAEIEVAEPKRRPPAWDLSQRPRAHLPVSRREHSLLGCES